ncbi:MAG TPA: dihydrodipicolinate synthase family protein [Vicinamibacterales bacterium]|jgi:4-hydroxy-2-oxoglutarate aldolase
MKLHGVFAPIPTPFDDANRVDPGRIAAAFARWLTRPITGFVVLGSNGEAVFLSEEESDRVVAAARQAVPSERPLIVGTGRESTDATVRASKRAAELGADAVLVRTPAFFKSQMTHDAFVRHYTAVADASPVPVLLYNFTALTGVNLLPATVAQLASHPNIIGMKESGGDVAQISDLVSSTPAGFAVLAGTTSTFYAALCVGAVGGILAPACVAPESCTRLYDLTKAARHDDARALQRRLMPIARLLGPTYGVPGLKAALKIAGYDLGIPRPPLAPVPDAAIALLAEALAQLEEIPA